MVRQSQVGPVGDASQTKEIATHARRRSDLIIGTGPAMARILELVAVAARTDITVLILGESGTGKELVARAVHYTGSRANRPFLTINCGATRRAVVRSGDDARAVGRERGASHVVLMAA